MENTSTCQLYKYDTDFFLVTKNNPAFFATDFNTNQIDDNFVSWLNFHNLNDRENIEKLCDRLEIDKLMMGGTLIKELESEQVWEKIGEMVISQISKH